MTDEQKIGTAVTRIYDRLDELVAARACPYCKATPGEPCRTRETRKLLPYGPHTGRSTDLWEAYRLGRERERMIRPLAPTASRS